MTSQIIRSQEPIIIVDDDLDDHFIFKEICGRLHLKNELKFHKNGEELIAYLKQTADKPFIILCDINMPGVNGLDLRKRISDNDYLRKKSVPFIFFSTAASPRQINEAYELTVQGFFLKQSSFIETEKTFRLILQYWDTCLHPNSRK
jgi:CheY-like chemotaxis protein